MLALASSSRAVSRVKPVCLARSAPPGVTEMTEGSSDCQVTARSTGRPRLSHATASSGISSPTPTARVSGPSTISSALGEATSTLSPALTPLHVAVICAEPAARAIAVAPPFSTRSTSGASLVQATDEDGSRLPCRPLSIAISSKLSPTSKPAGGGRIAMRPTALPDAAPAAADGLVNGAGLVGVGSSDASGPSPTASRLSSARSGSSSASGAAPSAAIASPIRGHRAAGSFASMRRMAVSSSGGQSAKRSRRAGGGWSRWACMMVSVVDPLNGGVPVTIS